PDDQPDGDPEERDRVVGRRLLDREERRPGRVPVLVDRGEREPRAERGPAEPERHPRRSHAGPPTTAASVVTDSSLFGMNAAGRWRARGPPRAAALRLDVRTPTGGSGSAPSARATSKPVVSGSRTSSSTTSGRRARAAASADAPSPASPTTSRPAASSSLRA